MIGGPEYTSKARRARNRPMAKLPRAELAAAVGAYDRVLVVSTEIRGRHGLAPLDDGQSIGAARARLAAFKKPRAKVKAKRRGPSVTALRAQLKASQSEVTELVELVGLLQRREPTAV
jgi:hypothetical protein